MSRRYTEEDHKKWEELYLQGNSLTKVARLCGCDVSTIYQALKKRGVKFRHELRPVTTLEVARWVKVYLETGDLGKVLSTTDRSELTVLKHLVRALREYALRSQKGP